MRTVEGQHKTPKNKDSKTQKTWPRSRWLSIMQLVIAGAFKARRARVLQRRNKRYPQVKKNTSRIEQKNEAHDAYQVHIHAGHAPPPRQAPSGAHRWLSVSASVAAAFSAMGRGDAPCDAEKGGGWWIGFAVVIRQWGTVGDAAPRRWRTWTRTSGLRPSVGNPSEQPSVDPPGKMHSGRTQ